MRRVLAELPRQRIWLGMELCKKCRNFVGLTVAGALCICMVSKSSDWPHPEFQPEEALPAIAQVMITSGSTGVIGATFEAHSYGLDPTIRWVQVGVTDPTAS